MSDSYVYPELDKLKKRVDALEADPPTYPKDLVEENKRLKNENDTMARTIGFLACTIKCGEPWTEKCEEMVRAALDERRALEKT